MIPLVPYQKFVIEVPYSREELIRRLGSEISGRPQDRGSSGERTKSFKGEISDEGFQISRIINYRNSFLPVIEGRFSPQVKGVRVEIKMKLHSVVLIFCIVWLCFFGRFVIAAATNILDAGRVNIRMLFPFGIFLLFYLIATIAFGVEAKKASRLLIKIFGVEGFA